MYSGGPARPPAPYGLVRSGRSLVLGVQPQGYSAEQVERLRQIHERLTAARRELDALIGDAYLRPRASIVPVHFLDLASAVEKLRWAEKEWRELDRELAEAAAAAPGSAADSSEPDDGEPHHAAREPVPAETH
ncbi:MAG TPA: hypothetical protein VHJ76_04730 [Actinomycetota bacterium]|nr:hypothetical protein [Actinomycetota bacterium]